MFVFCAKYVQSMTGKYPANIFFVICFFFVDVRWDSPWDILKSNYIYKLYYKICRIELELTFFVHCSINLKKMVKFFEII